MKRNEWLVRATLAFCLVYGVIALPNRSHEKFPFFSWDLFSKVPPPRVSDFSVRLVQGNGVHVPLPVYFESSNMQSQVFRSQGFQAIQTWGTNYVKGDKPRAFVLRRKFELTYLSSLSSVRYQLVRRVFDIRERLDCNDCFIREKVLATYTVG